MTTMPDAPTWMSAEAAYGWQCGWDARTTTQLLTIDLDVYVPEGVVEQASNFGVYLRVRDDQPSAHVLTYQFIGTRDKLRDMMVDSFGYELHEALEALDLLANPVA